MSTLYYHFTIIGMSCEHCKAAVENAVRAIPGVLQAAVNLENGDLSVRSEREIRSEIQDSIEQIGFEIRELSSP